METRVKISDYSDIDAYTHVYYGDNCSSIITTMVQLAGRLCERYAGDIIYDASEFMHAVKENKLYDRYLFFRECGVTSFSRADIVAIHGIEHMQAWHLTYNAETQKQEFKRVYVDIEKYI